jgi:hypothetical protein
VPVVGTSTSTDNSTKAASTAFVKNALRHAGCGYFKLDSSTQCGFRPKDGNKIKVNGTWYDIPAGSVTVSNAGCVGNTTYFAYANDDGSGGLALTLSTTSHGPAARRRTKVLRSTVVATPIRSLVWFEQTGPVALLRPCPGLIAFRDCLLLASAT